MSVGSLVQATRQLPSSVVIITTQYGEERDAMIASAMFVSETPPLLMVSISKTFQSYQLIEKSHEFVINVLGGDKVGLANQLGSTHGQKTDKLAKFNVITERGSKIEAPLICGCFANIECKVKTSLWDVEGEHAIYLAEVVAYKSNSDLLPLVWLNNKYYRIGDQCKS
jgi:flavin reductase (DIM6/NTAB) family NADH-FMN oxidoreductase RutF